MIPFMVGVLIASIITGFPLGYLALVYLTFKMVQAILRAA